MTDRELDRMMQHVLLDAIKRDCEKETDDVPAFKPTLRYQRQMAAMLSDPLKWAQKRARPLWKNVAQKIAVILLVFSLSLGSLMAVSPTVRAAVVRWVTEWYETHVVYRHLGVPVTGEIPQYTITDLPDGYVEDSEQNISEDDFACKVYYNAESDRSIYFDYAYMQQGTAWTYVTEDAENIAVTVNGLEGEMFLTDDWENTRNTITWFDPQTNIQFSLNANVSQDDILHIAESVSLLKTEN